MSTPTLTKEKTTFLKKSIPCIMAGFSVFAMFFGSGNLVFPIEVGKIVGSHYSVAMLGFLVSGILIPSLGLLGIIKFRGSLDNFFGKLGRHVAFLLPFLMLCLLGPFGVIPRCLNVAHASLEMATGGFPLWLFATLFCGSCYIIIRNKLQLLDLIGGLLTPILLFSLAAVILTAITSTTPLPSTAPAFTNTGSFLKGVLKGYQLMDLLAAFFFAITIMEYLNQKLNPETDPDKHNPKSTLVAILIGGGLLAIVYGFMVYLGSHYASILKGLSAENYISAIAFHTLGSSAGLVVSMTVILACLTTAVALAKISTTFMQEKLLRGKLGFNTCLLVILSITFLFSFFKFSGIIAFLGPILEVLYPSLIVICLCNLFFKDMPALLVKGLFFGSVLVSLGIYLW